MYAIRFQKALSQLIIFIRAGADTMNRFAKVLFEVNIPCARVWDTKALELAERGIHANFGKERNRKCDTALFEALYNLGMLAEVGPLILP